MKSIFFIVFSIFALALTAYCDYAVNCSGEHPSNNILIEDLRSYFTNYEGCFVLYDNGKQVYTIYNESKSEREISPCSTFKVVNTLIGLEAGVVADENTVFKWDGTKYQMDSWNRDFNMAQAISLSAYWYYQVVARKVGEKRMRYFINALDYGNKDISGGIDQFWEQSSLRISPKESVDILRKIYFYDVPFSRRNVDILKKIIKLKEKDGSVLYGKTGAGMTSPGFAFKQGDECINGWFIGFVENKNRVYFFAANINAKKDATGYKAREITLEILQDKGIF